MLRACALESQGSWDEHLPLVEFANNNSFHTSIGISPYEVLCGRPCRLPICLEEIGDRALLGPKIVEQTTEKISDQSKNEDNTRQIEELCRQAMMRSRVRGRRPCWLRVVPIKSVRRFGVTGKLSPRYISPFEILRQIGTLAYELALPPQLSHSHIMLHISKLRKYVPDPQYVIDF